MDHSIKTLARSQQKVLTRLPSLTLITLIYYAMIIAISIVIYLFTEFSIRGGVVAIPPCTTHHKRYLLAYPLLHCLLLFIML